MARDGSGNYSRVAGPYVNGSDIVDADTINAEIDDIGTALSDSINRAGTKAMAADLPMGGFTLTGLGAGAVNGESVRYEQLTALSSVYQPLDATLTAVAGGTPAANTFWVWSGVDAGANLDISANAQSFLAAADYAAMRTALGVPLGTSGAVVPILNGNAVTFAPANASPFRIDQNNAATALYVTGGSGGNTLARFERDVGSVGYYEIRQVGGYIQCLVDAASGTGWAFGTSGTTLVFASGTTGFSGLGGGGETARLTLSTSAITVGSGVTLQNSSSIAYISNLASLTDENTLTDLTADYVPFYDASATANRRTLAINLRQAAPDIILEAQFSSGTGGGTATSGSDQTRPLNTEVRDVRNECALSSNQFTLTAGSYYVEAEAIVHDVNQHQALIYNVTGATELLRGTTGYVPSTAMTSSDIKGVITVAAAQALELRHRVNTTKASIGFGFAGSFGVERYARVCLWRLS